MSTSTSTSTSKNTASGTSTGNVSASGKSLNVPMSIEEKGGKSDHPSKPATQPSTSSKGDHPSHSHYITNEYLTGSLWTLKTTKPWKLICEDLPSIVREQKFSVLGHHDLRDTLAKTGSHYLDDEAMIFELCNANTAGAVLSQRLDLAAILPCRLAICRKSGEPGSTIHLFLPTTLIENCFDQKMEENEKNELKDLAQNTTNILKEIAKIAANK